jgi:glutaredoxin
MPFHRICSWITRRAARPALTSHIQLLTRDGCHLCDAAWDRLRAGQRRYGFQLTVIDVDSDAALRAEYGAQVPVVLVNGKARFRGEVNPVLLERLLSAEANAERPA